ncbi:putative fluoride ion transporter CrcB 2 [Dictyobacter vulcani]|uniref:Fluoride-specific ion channel FluC n=1 Tax=Dictyobacter vulcani TaxID=2607529 RepID=A0A5J4KRH9_9CHLR|nr:fluoride efflux transporter CrcB [Dictyobacter vulcani]GER91984.1 putative fluoride ion transporter CrcB 2 [Dictyobacter vulcani]
MVKKDLYIHRLLMVFSGGFLGTMARYLLSQALQGAWGKGWPYDILLINLTGAFALAFLTMLADAALFIGPRRRLVLNVGFLGAYTTFSSLALGDMTLLTGQKLLLALLYLVCSLGGGMIAVLLGQLAALWLIRRQKGA